MNIKKYFAIFKFSLKKQFAFKLNYFTILFSYTIHIFTLSCLWDYVLKGDSLVGYTKTELIWYIIMAEFITYTATKSIYKKIGEMIRNGEIANMLIRPINFVTYIFSEECASIIQNVVNAFLGIILGIIFAGFINITGVQLIFIIVSVIIAIIMQIMMQILIGLIAFFTEENKAFYLILSKLQLLVVLTPIEFYPVIVQKLFYFLPITYAIYVPSKLLVHFDILNAIKLLIFEIVALLVLIVTVNLLYKKGVKKINVNGG